jgi:hypothetical protein
MILPRYSNICKTYRTKKSRPIALTEDQKIRPENNMFLRRRMQLRLKYLMKFENTIPYLILLALILRNMSLPSEKQFIRETRHMGSNLLRTESLNQIFKNTSIFLVHSETLLLIWSQIAYSAVLIVNALCFSLFRCLWLSSYFYL